MLWAMKTFVTAAEFSEDAATARDGTVPGGGRQTTLSCRKLYRNFEKLHENTFYW